MLGWSLNLFRIGGIQLSVHVSFFLLLAWVAWEGWRVSGWTGAVWSVAATGALFTCVTLHELGHAIAARRFGVRVPRIVLLPIGGMAEMDSIPRSPRQEIIIAMAGPAVNYAILGVLMIFVRFPARWYPTFPPTDLVELLRYLVLVNVVMGLFNLLPAFPMDGGRVLRALLAVRMPYMRATRYAAGLGKIVALAGAAYLAYNGNHLGWLLFAFIIFAGEIELRAVVRAEREAEHWRETQTRLQPVMAAPPPPDSPPTRVI